jgi:hypothetical protein
LICLPQQKTDRFAGGNFFKVLVDVAMVDPGLMKRPIAISQSLQIIREIAICQGQYCARTFAHTFSRQI